MGQKVHPRGFRVGVYSDWDAKWFAPSKSYGDHILEDIKIRRFLEHRLEAAQLARVEIEKAGDNVRVIIHSGKPGTVIGKKGQEIESLRQELSKLLKKNNVEVSVQEVAKPEVNATLIAKDIAAQLVRRGSYKRAMNRAILTAIKAGAKGIKVRVAGRIGGAEIARSEDMRVGSMPLHTLRADIEYGFAEAKTTYGILGVKVWLCKGEVSNVDR